MYRYLIFFLCSILTVQASRSQNALQLSHDKTTSLIFPFSIVHVDRGSKDILVQPLKNPSTVLLVKAGCKDFHPTNLSVATSDGSIYTFLALYDSFPRIWVYRLPIQDRATPEQYANGILDNPPVSHQPRTQHWDMHLANTGIYIRDNLFYFQLSIRNSSPVDYDIDFIRFYIRDRKTGKRTARQEVEIGPLLFSGNRDRVPGNSQLVTVAVLDKFTIADKKMLVIEVGERNGGRGLVLKIRNRHLLKARLLPAVR